MDFDEIEGRFVLGGLAHHPFEVVSYSGGVVVAGDNLQVVGFAEFFPVLKL